MTLVVAIYAAVVATAGVGWTIFTWRRATRAARGVRVHGDLVLRGASTVVTAIRVTTINEGPLESTVRRVLVHSFGDPGRLWMAEAGEQGLPLTISPRRRAEFSFDVTEGSLVADEPLIARIWTESGKEFLSGKGPLLAADSD